MRRSVEAWFVRAMKTTIQTTTIQTTSGFSRVSKRSGECRYRRAKKDFTSSSSSGRTKLLSRSVKQTTHPKVESSKSVNEIPLLATTTFVGVAVASFWRGAWYVLDETVFPLDARKSGLACFAAGVCGLATSQHVKLMMLKDMACTTKTTNQKRVMLFSPPTYFVGLSCVLFWRGVWCLWDSATDAYFVLKDGEDSCSSSSSSGSEDASGSSPPASFFFPSSYSPKLKSGIVSHAAGATALVATGFLASAACPPAGLWVARDAATAVKVARLASRR
jgi:hypothetical protein